jgi:hypothetical protein
MLDDDTTTLSADTATTTETTSYDRDEVTPEQFHAANLADAATFILIQLHAPEQVLRLWPALTGLMAGRATVVTFYRLDLARRLFGRGYMSEDECKRVSERVSNYLGAMRDWIHREGLEGVVKYQPGDKETPNSIRTPILKWVVELATLAGERLTPDSPDDQRRGIFKDEAVRLLHRKRLTKRQKPYGQRVKRTVSPATQLKQAKALIRNFYFSKVDAELTKHVKVENADTQIKAFILNELEGFVSRLCMENSVGENAKVGSANNYHKLNIDDDEKEHRGGARKKTSNVFVCSVGIISDFGEPDYSDEVSPYDMAEPFDLMEVTR